jgi:hypothetical protein
MANLTPGRRRRCSRSTFRSCSLACASSGGAVPAGLGRLTDVTVDVRRRTGSVTSVVLAGCPEERIITLAPVRSQQSYRHEAFLWHDASDFTAGIVPFITDGLEAGEPVMVAVGALHTKWLRDALDGQADVEFVDMEQLGRNPAQIIPAWQQFLNTGSGRFRPVRGVGEPIWPGRRPEELVE